MTLDLSATTFEGERKRLTMLAYRMLGRWSEAEDAVQDGYLRWQAADQSEIRVPGAWLTTTVVRLCLDRMRKAKASREVYVGPWLPEPVLTPEGGEREMSADPTSFAQDLSMGLMLVLERLGPEERAAFILREAFDSSYSEIAAALGKSEVAVRQLVSRARERVKGARKRYDPPPGAHEKLMSSLLHAIEAKDPTALAGLLTKDASFTSDAGGKRPAALRVVTGADEVAKLILHVTTGGNSAKEMRRLDFNGARGLWVVDQRGYENAIQIEIDGEHISAIYIVRNPDKLAHISAAMH
ncbi:MAG: sigma-70 family RNA polymerase sigma factor [Alphaproteobacteria bacterium]|nr:sigma-70 family RNA polymerase sigma factor [Alphaproteobacteria bacterium]